jgi:hypothetical protein
VQWLVVRANIRELKGVYINALTYKYLLTLIDDYLREILINIYIYQTICTTNNLLETHPISHNPLKAPRKAIGPLVNYTILLTLVFDIL